MNLKSVWNRRTVFALTTLVVIATAVLRNAGVSEVHRAHDPINFDLVDPKPGPSDWPWGRGTDSMNMATDASPPLHWSNRKNYAWQSPMPGRGHAAPCVWGTRLFVTTADPERQTVSLLCVDRETGRSLWQSELHRGGLPDLSARESHASTTPACDGQYVYVPCVVNGTLSVTAVDFIGRIVWQKVAGPFGSRWSYRSSPAIYKSLVIVAADNEGTPLDRLVGASYLAAMHRQSGEVVWRIKRPDADSFGTPIIARVAGRDQLLLAGKGLVAAYDPATGTDLWTCRWSAERASNSVAFDDRHVFVSSRQPQDEMICIRGDGHGDVTETHVVWRDTTSACGATSPLVFEGLLYSLAEEGILACLDAATGKVLWKRKLGGTVTSSPLIAGHFLYCCNDDGVTFVVKLGGKGEVVAENSVGDSLLASPVVSGNKLFLRTRRGLHCLAPAESEPFVQKPDEDKRRL